MLLVIDPNRLFFNNSVSETKGLQLQNSPKTGFPDRSASAVSLIRATFHAEEQVHGSALSNRGSPIWNILLQYPYQIAWTGAIDNAECKSMLQIADRRLLNADPKPKGISETS